MRQALSRPLIILTVILCASAALAAKPPSVRGVWVATSGFATADATDKTIAKCKRAGLNVLIPNVMSHGSLFYKSAHYLHNVVPTAQFDPLAYLIQKAHASGMQVHPWFNVYYETAEGGVPPAKPEWLCRDFDGRVIGPQKFLSPAIPGVNEYLLSVIKDVLAYDIDGIHLDYIRYAGTQYDYSEVARKRFSKERGFDPIDFIDHGDAIAPNERFPIRLLRTSNSYERTWENCWAEKLLDSAGVGFAQIREKPENVDALKAPGLLILSSYYVVSPEILAALKRYLERGGNVLSMDAPATTLRNSPELRAMLGVKGTKWTPARIVSLEPAGNHPLAKYIHKHQFLTESNAAVDLDGAVLVAKLATGEPALTVNHFGKGQVALLNFNAAKAGAPVELVKGICDWLRGKSGPDLLAAKRQQWDRWRGDQVTQLVRAVHDAAKSKNPKLIVSSSGGPTPQEFYSCYRDAKRWLAENLTDYSFPMNYTDSPEELRLVLKNQIAATPKGANGRIFPGLQIYTSKTVNGKRTAASQDAEIVAQQLKIVREMGYNGFVLFADVYLTDDLADAVRQSAVPF